MSDVMVAVIALAATCGYVVIAGLVHVVASEKLDEVLAPMAAALWPLIPPIAFVAVLLKTLAVHIPRAIVTSMRRWRARPRIPKAQVRRGG